MCDDWLDFGRRLYGVLAAQRYQLWAVAYFWDCSADKLVPRFGPTTALKPRSPKSRAIGTPRFLTIVPTTTAQRALIAEILHLGTARDAQTQQSAHPNYLCESYTRHRGLFQTVMLKCR